MNRLFQLARPNDFWFSITFGLIGLLFSFLKIEIPNLGNAYSDLYEIPLLISLLYLRNPLWIVVINLIAILNLSSELIFLPTLLMHLVPHLVMWRFFQWVLNKNLSSLSIGLVSGVSVVIYYFALLFPNFVLTYQLTGLDSGQAFGVFYSQVALAAKYEMIATALVTSLYIVQFDTRSKLEFTNRNLEAIVNERTMELRITNEKLLSTNNQVKALNENLEGLIKERTEKINYQLSQLNKYAHMNSHELRGPMARVLGLLDLLRFESSDKARAELVDKLYTSGEELDRIIKHMNGLLTEETEVVSR